MLPNAISRFFTRLLHGCPVVIMASTLPEPRAPPLLAEPKVEPEAGPKNTAPEAPELLILRAAADDPQQMVLRVMSIKRRRRARVRAANAFVAAAAAAAAPPKPPRPPPPKGEAALRPLERLLDRLSGVAATARRASGDPFCNSRARCKVVMRAALDARLDARKELDLIMTGERSRAYRRLKKTTTQLEHRLAPLELVDVTKERKQRAARDARCAAWLAEHLPDRAEALTALCALLSQHRALERSWTFQRALFFEQLRLTGATGGSALHEREALSYGTTSFAAFCALLAAPCLAAARERGETCVVLGASTGTLCFYAAALGFDVRGVDVMEPLVAVSRSLAITHHAVGVDAGAFRVLDIRDDDVGRVVRGATLVIVASSCWGAELCDAYAEMLEKSLDSDATVVDFSAHLEDRPPFTKVGEVRADASWGSTPLRVYRRW